MIFSKQQQIYDLKRLSQTFNTVMASHMHTLNKQPYVITTDGILVPIPFAKKIPKEPVAPVQKSAEMGEKITSAFNAKANNGMISSTEPGVTFGATVNFGPPISDKTVDPVQTGASGSYALDASTAKQLQEQFDNAATFLTDEAKRQATAGNPDFAQELLEGAQYAGECAKTFGQCLTMKLGGNINDIPFVKEMQELRYPNRPEPEQAAPVLVEPKYKGVIQEWCAGAGCKGGDLGFMVMQAVITHKIAGISSGLKPPTILNPGGVAIQGAVAEGVIAEQAIKTGIVIAESHGPEQSGGGNTSSASTGDQKPPQEAPFKESEAPQKSMPESDKVVPAVKAEDLAEVAKDLKRDESCSFSVLKSYIDKGLMKDNRIEAMIDADSKIVFRKDFGEEYAHGLTEKRGYTPGIDDNHYNIDIVTRKYPGTTIERWNKVHVFHIVIDELGNVTDFY